MIQSLAHKKPVLLKRMLDILKHIFTPQSQQRAKRMASLIAELAKDNELAKNNERAKNNKTYRLVNDLAETTGLGETVLPLLADLKKRGLVEQKWFETKSGPQLAYCLTPEGLKEAKRS